MAYKKQEHRYVYPGTEGQGHIFGVGQDVGYCGIKKDTLKKKAKELDARLATVSRFREDQQLCKKCQNVLKGYLAEKHGISGW